jgi:type I restriction enzyme S subunit
METSDQERNFSEPPQKDTEVSEGWAFAALPELIGPGGVFTDGDWVESKDQNPNGDVRLIQLADIGDGYYKNKSSRFLTYEKALELGCTFLQEGDVLVARLPEPLGRACIFPGDSKRAVTAVDICIVRPDVHCPEPRWIMHVLNSPTSRRVIESLHRGTTRKRISRKNLAAIKLPVAPLLEQKRIVAKIEQLLAQVNATRERLAKVPAVLKRFRQTVLAAACSGRLTEDWREAYFSDESAQVLLERIRTVRKNVLSQEGTKRQRNPGSSKLSSSTTEPNSAFDVDVPAGWMVASVDDLTLRITSGSRDWKRYYCDDGPGTFVMAQNVRPLRFDQSYRFGVAPPENDRDRERSQVKEGDILVTIVGANTGDVCRVSRPVEQHYVCQSVALMRPVVEEISPFLELLLNSPQHGQSQYGEWIYGEGRPHLSFDHLRATAVLLPPLSEQQEILRRVQSLFELADTTEKRLAIGTRMAERLTEAILTKAFHGELVPTEAELARSEGRSYEPATALLARVKALSNSSKSRLFQQRQNHAYGIE